MVVLKTLFLPPLIALILCCHLGYTCGHVLLPPELRPYRWLLTPLAGCATFVLVTAVLTTATALAPLQVALALAALALPVNIWLIWRGQHRSSPDNGTGHQGAAGVRLPRDTLATGVVVLLALLAFALAIAPPLRWGLSVPIGSNWDAAEFYVPLGRALQLHSQHDLGLLPRNPLVNIFTTAPVSGRIHAFSYLHAAVSSLVGIEPLATYAPLMALTLAFQPLAVYPLARTVGLPRPAALLATALLALGWLPLWVTYNSFSNHLFSLPLLPVALVSGIVALQRGGRQAVATGALFAAALATAYYPAMTAYAALFGPMAAYLVWRAPQRAACVRRTLAMGAAALVISAPAQWYFFGRAGFLDEMLSHGSGFQIAEFVRVADALGLQATFNRESVVAAPWLIALATGLALLLPAIALASRRFPLLAAAMAGCGAYQAYTAIQRYHYGFYKGVTFQLPIYAMLLVAGAVSVWDLSGRHPGARRLAGTCLAAGVALVIGLNADTVWHIQQHYTAAGPQLWTRSQLEVTELRAQTGPAANVLVVPDSHAPPVFNSLISYALLGHRLSGQFPTGYNKLDAIDTARPADAALLSADSDPATYGFDTRDLTWAGAGMRLYARQTGVRVHRAFGSGGRYPQIAPAATFQLQVGPDQIAMSPEQPPAPAASRQVQLTLALGSFERTTIEITTGGTKQRYTLDPGITAVTTTAVRAPATVAVHNLGPVPVYGRWGEVRDAVVRQGMVASDDVIVQVLPQPGEGGGSPAYDLRVHTQALPGGSQKLTGLVIVSYTVATQTAAKEIGRYVFFPSGVQPWHLKTNLTTRAMTLTVEGHAADLFGSTEATGDGDYQVTLLLANNAQIVYATPLWTWHMAGGQPAQVTMDAVPFDIVPLPQPATVRQAIDDAGSLRLRGYTLPRSRLRRGDQTELDLVWQGLQKIPFDYRVRVTLRDTRGGILTSQTVPLGAAGHGTSTWQEGESAAQRVLLAIPPAAPAATATLSATLVRPDGKEEALGGRQSFPLTDVVIGP